MHERISVITALQIDAILPSVAKPIDVISRFLSSILRYVCQHTIIAKRIRRSWANVVDC